MVPTCPFESDPQLNMSFSLSEELKVDPDEPGFESIFGGGLVKACLTPFWFKLMLTKNNSLIGAMSYRI